MKEYLKKFIVYLEFEKRYSSHTLQSYNTDLLQFFNYINQFHPSLNVESINPIIIRSWMVNLLNSNEKNSTVNRKISSVRSFFKFLQKQSLVKSNPTTNLIRPKISKRLPKDIRSDKLLEFKQKFEEFISNEEDTFLNFRDYTMFCLLYATGMRRAELVALSWDDIDFHNKVITVFGKGKKVRKIPISSSLEEILNNYKSRVLNNSFSPEENKVIVLNNGRKTYPNFIYRTIKKYLNQISQSDGVGPHTLRHSFATHILNEGAELNAIKDLLGHSSLAATQVYTSSSIEKLKNIHKSFHPKS